MSARALLLACLCALASTAASAVCEAVPPAGADAKAAAIAMATTPAPARWQPYFVADALLDPGLFLLGLDGSRVEAGRDVVDVELKDGRMRLATPWLQRVDWSVYTRPFNRLRPTAVLYVDTGSDGSRYPCRLERRVLTAAARARLDAMSGDDARVPDDDDAEAESLQLFPRRRGRPVAAPSWTAADLAVSAVERYGYDERRQLVSVETFQRDDGASAWRVGESVCATVGGNGAVAAVVRPEARPCAAATAGDVGSRYVYGADGRLLREIGVERRGDDAAAPVRTWVRTYDAGGALHGTYEEDEGRRPLRLPDAVFLRDGQGPTVLSVGSAAELNKFARPPGAWRMVAAPLTTSTEQLAWGLNVPALQQGRVGRSGRLELSPSQLAAVWTAMHDESSVLVFVQGIDSIVLVPATPDAVWKACLDTSRTTRDACP